jgi:hypothetical protein
MQVEKSYHNCGYVILIVREMVGPVKETYLVDGKDPFSVDKDGVRRAKKITKCPECGAFLRLERLSPNQPA